MTDPAQPLDPQHVLHLKLGLIWHHALEKLITIEDEFGKLEEKHTGKEILAHADTSLLVIAEAARDSLRIMADDPTMAATHDRIRSLLFHTHMPTPLYLIAMENREVWHGRLSPLFGKGGVPSFNFLRRQVEALAAACVQVLSENDLPKNQAAELLAKHLNEHAFPNPKKDPYSADTVLGWMKRRKKRQRTEGMNDTGDFEANFRRYCVYLRGIAGPIASRGNIKGAREAVLQRFNTFLDHSIIYPKEQ